MGTLHGGRLTGHENCETTIFLCKDLESSSNWNVAIYKWLFGVPVIYLGGGNSNIFLCSLRKLGNILLFDEHNFQVGWNQLDIHHLEVVCLVGDSFYFRNHSSLCFIHQFFVNIYFQSTRGWPSKRKLRGFSLLSIIATSLHLKDTWMSQKVSKWFVNGL